jgi:RHS repeat-associated protein
LLEGGYIELPGLTGYWAPSGSARPQPDRFWLPDQVRDPWGNVTSVEYDAYSLFPASVVDAAGNTVQAVHDYRVLAPALVTDPNGNRRMARFDALGAVVAEAVMGKLGSSDGDTLDDPTVRYTYARRRYLELGLPASAKAEARERHGAAQYAAPPGRWQTTWTYSDGSGRVAMLKARAEAGEAPLRDASGALVRDDQGRLVLGPVTERWVGTGKTIRDNKGQVVKQYDPFFSSTAEYETEAELVAWGTTPVFTYDPPGRLVRTELPHGGVARAAFDAWSQTSWDENDTAADAGNAWMAARQPGASPAPSAEELRAAALTLGHAGTPTTTHVDALGRPFLVEQRRTVTEVVATRTQLDADGQALAIIDALGRACLETAYGLLGRALRTRSIDAGERSMLADVAGAALGTWDASGREDRVECDVLRRPTHRWVREANGPERLMTRTLYGESYPDPEIGNRRGRACLVFDGAGLAVSDRYDFKGNPLTASRRVSAVVEDEPDWSVVASSGTPSAAIAAGDAMLEPEVFAKAFAYDALNRVVSATTPDGSETRPGYNDAGLLEAIEVRIRGSAAWAPVVENIDYDALGRRTRVHHGNATTTTYAYDPLSKRLVRLRTDRGSDGAILQNLGYTYDCVGNIVAVADSAQQSVYFDDALVTPSAAYEYDALYRLTSATGREHAGTGSEAQRDHQDAPLRNLPHPNDAQALRRYEERYAYDGVGNILEMLHDAGPGQAVGSWTRRYRYGAGSGDGSSNRLHSTSLPGDAPSGSYSATYGHDARGNMTSMPHLASVSYTHRDQMRRADLGGGGVAYYAYDGAGERVRKQVARIGTLVEERIYLGGCEVYRKRDHTGLLLERQTLHVMDGARRVAMFETKTVDADAPASVGVTRARHQYSNHLDSAVLEADEGGSVISYEEYHPYGTTAYRSARSGVEVSERRYRYTGKERDEETGFYYHGARYYASWLGRWTSADPAGMVDGPGLYSYARDNPVGVRDASGRQGVEVLKTGIGDATASYRDGAVPDVTPSFEDEGSGKRITDPDEQDLRKLVGRPILQEIAAEQAAKAAALPTGPEDTPTIERPLANALVTFVPKAIGVFFSGNEEGAAQVEGLINQIRPFPNTEETPPSEKGMEVVFDLAIGAVAGAAVEAASSGALAKSLGGGMEADAALGRSVSGFDTSRVGVGPAFDSAKLARIEQNLTAEGFKFEYNATTLDAARAGAAYLVPERGGPGTVLLRPSPTRAEVIEELMHLGQHRKAGFPGKDIWGETRISREMQAQVRLWDLAEKRGWTAEEQKGFLEAWRFWQGQRW